MAEFLNDYIEIKDCFFDVLYKLAIVEEFTHL